MNDAAAYGLAKPLLLGSCTEAELHYLLAVSRLESGYGDAWKEGRGAGSNNMGAIQVTPAMVAAGVPFFETRDTHEDGKPYVGRFRVYPSKQHGLIDLARVLLRPNVRAAIARGDANAAVLEQRRNGYFEAPLARYQQAMADHYARFLAGTGLKPELRFSSTTGNGAGLLLLAAAIALGFS